LKKSISNRSHQFQITTRSLPHSSRANRKSYRFAGIGRVRFSSCDRGNHVGTPGNVGNVLAFSGTRESRELTLIKMTENDSWGR